MSKERKGLFSPLHEKQFAQMLDDIKKFDNPILEMGDGKVAHLTVMFIDNVLLEKIPQEFQNPLEPIIDKIFEGKREEALDLLTEFMNGEIDIQGVNEEFEANLIRSALDLFALAIMKYLAKVG